MKKIKIFVDSDVIISSLISTSGAAYFLIHKTTEIELVVSNYSIKELNIVVERLQLNKEKLNELINQKFQVVQMLKSLDEIKKQYKEFIYDINDTHIVAGATNGKVKFLVSYNIKHFHAEKLQQDLNILPLTPAKMAQYLRSLK